MIIHLQYRSLRFTLAIAFMAPLAGCSPDDGGSDAGDPGLPASEASSVQTETPITMDNVAKVKVLADGTVLLEDEPIAIDALKVVFSDLKDSNGIVWYYRENAETEPPPEAMLVIQAIADEELPVRLSSMRDFSDSVGPGGN